MLGLLLTTIVTSAADSLNPVAITQQFVLQGMVKKPKHIWFFILPTGITNFIGGVLAYLGLASFITGFFQGILENYSPLLFGAELLLGIAFCIRVGFLIKGRRRSAALKAAPVEGRTGEEEAETAQKIKSVSPLALVFLGVGATISELVTALPYFAFLAVLLKQSLRLPHLLFLLLVYNFIYSLPLILLYLLYRKGQGHFDRLYRLIKDKLKRWSGILTPSLVAVIGIVLTVHALSFFIRL